MRPSCYWEALTITSAAEAFLIFRGRSVVVFSVVAENPSTEADIPRVKLLKFCQSSRRRQPTVFIIAGKKIVFLHPSHYRLVAWRPILSKERDRVPKKKNKTSLPARRTRVTILRNTSPFSTQVAWHPAPPKCYRRGKPAAREAKVTMSHI